MKTAICINGYFSNKNGDNLFNSNYIYDNIINKCDNIDIFIHSFDKDNESKILSKYPNTKYYVIEKQIDFINNTSKENYEYYKEMHRLPPNGCDLQSTLSFLYSRCKSIKYALQYSKENNFVYDCIIRCRFDNGIRLKKPDDAGYKTDNIIFNPSLDFRYFYTPYWNQLNAGYNGFWEFSNATNMEIFSGIYDYLINHMFLLNSEYLLCLQSCWPDSDINSPYSNVMLSTEVSNITPCSYALTHSYNSHLVEKFFIIKSNLYYKSKFIDYTNNIEKIY
jgi:hypothetical protein